MSNLSENKNVALDGSVQYVKGVGEKRALLLRNVQINSVRDILYYFPRRYLDRSTITRIKDLKKGMATTVIAKIESMEIIRGRRARAVALVTDATGFLQCVWFNRVNYWAKAFEHGEWVAFSGKISVYGGLQMAHPELDRLSDEGTNKFLHTGAIIPLYPSTEGLTRVGLDSRGFRRIIRNALDVYLPSVQEILSEDILRRQGLMPLTDALENIHFPKDALRQGEAQRRLKFEELFYLELMLAYRRKKFSVQRPGISFEKVGEKTERLLEQLPFELTDAQKRVVKQIRADMKKAHPMNRLLQGDVGSGKTIVALICMLIAVDNNYQAALMAPTEILAEQHFRTIIKYLEKLDVRVEILIGGQKSDERQRVLDGISSGDVDIVVGTHALIQEGVSFNRLGFVIVDEQHRFGVMQRAELRDKGGNPDVLVMTATPIPRTLSLTVYGDLDVSIIDEMPKGRKPIKTYWRYQKKRDTIYEWVREQVEDGRQAYIVYPLVEESEKMDLRAATESYEELVKGIFSEVSVGLIDGRMKPEDKDAIMNQFKDGTLKALVSTTVIEVGVDVPNATIMIIEHAERFGLSQLHQLRGRVGRGSEQSHCILIAYPPLSEDAQTRLSTMAKTTDGFRIAEIDLKLRGPGEFFGTKQSGLPEMKIADIIEDSSILIKARDEAFKLVEHDPQLLQQHNAAIREYYLQHYQKRYELAKVG